jgi:hypothetical protein
MMSIESTSSHLEVRYTLVVLQISISFVFFFTCPLDTVLIIGSLRWLRTVEETKEISKFLISSLRH